MDPHIFLTTISLPFVTILLVFGMKYFSAMQQAKAGSANDEAYRHIFELVWKIIWIVAFALPMWLGPGLDAYAAESLFACGVGVMMVALVLPWGYIVRHYIQAPSTPWSSKAGNIGLGRAG